MNDEDKKVYLALLEKRRADRFDLNSRHVLRDIIQFREAVLSEAREVLNRKESGYEARYNELFGELQWTDLLIEEQRTRPENQANRYMHAGPEKTTATGERWLDRRSGKELRCLLPHEKLNDHVQMESGRRESALSFGSLVRGLATGKWDSKDQLDEYRTLSVSSDIGGGFLVPPYLSSQVLDLARAQAVVFKAGATTLVMPTASVDIARVTADPSASWKAENAAITPSDVTFGAFNLSARTLCALVKLSVELAEDAPNAGSLIESIISKVLALELDRVCIRGTGASLEPGGIKDWYSKSLGVGYVNIGTNGALPGHDLFLDAITAILTANGPADGLSAIMSPRTWGFLSKLKNGDGETLIPPPEYTALKKLTTTQIQNTLAKGSSGAVASEIYVGDFSQLMVGMRTDLQLEISRQAADTTSSAFANLQVWIRAYLRADVILTQPTWFTYVDGVLNA
jgi:HK97 family phage major capsid protein